MIYTKENLDRVRFRTERGTKGQLYTIVSCKDLTRMRVIWNSGSRDHQVHYDKQNIVNNLSDGKTWFPVNEINNEYQIY